MARIISRIQNRYRNYLSQHCGRRVVDLRPSFPIVSFIFDDYPRSALREGGGILRQHASFGTYYAAFSLMNTEIPAGTAFTEDDLHQTVADGHELGCHTYAHSHAWETRTNVFERSIIDNRDTLNRLVPGAKFKTLSFPVSCPRPAIKRITEKYFLCCRGGGLPLNAETLQNLRNRGRAFNIGPVDVNNLQTYFLEKSINDRTTVKELIKLNAALKGWLILGTHDVSVHPSRFGCSPEFFSEIVAYTVKSGAQILPVGTAWETIHAFGKQR